MRRFGIAVTAVILAGCGSTSDAPVLPAAIVAEPTTTLFLVPSTVPPTMAPISTLAEPLLATWRYVAVESVDDAIADNLQQGFLRIEAPLGLALSVSSFRAADPNEYVCSESGGGGELEVDANTLRLTVLYETPAAECLTTIGDVPIVDSVSACLRDGCPYEIVVGQLRLTVGDAIAVLERNE